VPGVRLRHGGGDVDVGVVGVGQEQRHDDDLVDVRPGELVDHRVEQRLGQLEERGLDAEIGASLRTSAMSALIVVAERGSRLP